MGLSHGGLRAVLTLVSDSSEAAYSLRRVGAYSGPLIKVRRDSDNTELDISASTSKQGLDTTSLLNFVGNGSGFIKTWYDQSGNARDATQSTTALQPRIVLNGALDTKYGKETIIFTGAERLSAPSTLFGTSFAIVQRSGNNQVVSELSNLSTYRGLFPGTGGSATYWTHSQYAINGGTLAATQPTSAIGTNLYLLTGAGVTTTSRPHLIGYGSPSWESLIGCLSELIIYPTDISSKRSIIELNMKRYYSI